MSNQQSGFTHRILSRWSDVEGRAWFFTRFLAVLRQFMTRKMATYLPIQTDATCKRFCKEDESPSKEASVQKRSSVDDTTNILRNVWRPLHIGMTACGLVWRNTPVSELYLHRKFDCCTIHSIVVVILAWFNVLKHFPTYNKDDTYGTSLFRKISIHIFAMQMACGISTSIYFRLKHLPQFSSEWKAYKTKYGGVPVETMRKHVLARVVAINLTVGLVNLATSLYLTIVKPAVYYQQQKSLFMFLNEETQTWPYIANEIVNFYLKMAWVQSIIFTVCITKNLKDEFCFFTQELQIFVTNFKARNLSHLGGSSQNATHSKKDQIEAHRQQYSSLCQLVTSYDNVISVYLLFLYLFSIPIIVLIIYNLWNLPNESVGSFLMTVGTLLMFAAMLISVTGLSASLNTTVSA